MTQNKPEIDQLLPCPFCGGEGKIHTSFDPIGTQCALQVRCTKCYSSTKRTGNWSATMHICKWNTRAKTCQHNAEKLKNSDILNALDEINQVMCSAFHRIHTLPRTSDTALAKEIEDARLGIETIRTALTRELVEDCTVRTGSVDMHIQDALAHVIDWEGMKIDFGEKRLKETGGYNEQQMIGASLMLKHVKAKMEGEYK